MKKRLATIAAGLGTLAFVLVLSAACGGSGSQENADADVVVDFKVENLKYVPDSIEIPAGKTVRLRMQNLDAMEHDFQVDGLRVEMMGEMEMPGHHGASPSTLALHTPMKKSASLTFRADQPGTYDFYCTISGHKELGMAGKLTVS